MKDKLNARRDKMITYLILKVEEEDWHGVADAAMDLREIDSALNTLDTIKKDLTIE